MLFKDILKEAIRLELKDGFSLYKGNGVWHMSCKLQDIIDCSDCPFSCKFAIQLTDDELMSFLKTIYQIRKREYNLSRENRSYKLENLPNTIRVQLNNWFTLTTDLSCIPDFKEDKR